MTNFEFFGLKKQIILKKVKLPANFVDFKQTIIPAGDCFNKDWFFAMSIEGILQRKTRDFLERAISATSNEQIVQWVTSDFLQGATSATTNEPIFQQVTSGFCNKQLLQRLTSDFLQVATSATSNEQILQREASDFTMSNEQQVKRYSSTRTFIKVPSLL